LLKSGQARSSKHPAAARAGLPRTNGDHVVDARRVIAIVAKQSPMDHPAGASLVAIPS
jgi:hypothetical protein